MEARRRDDCLTGSINDVALGLLAGFDEEDAADVLVVDNAGCMANEEDNELIGVGRRESEAVFEDDDLGCVVVVVVDVVIGGRELLVNVR